MQCLTIISLVSYLTFLLISCYPSQADRTSQKIYNQIQGDLFCFRRLNATHQIGCTSKRSGNVGVVHVVSSTADLNWVLRVGPDPPYVVALPIRYFTTKTMRELKDSQRISGVLVLRGNGTTLPQEGFSPDHACPNDNFGLYTESSNPEYAHCQKQSWNPENPALEMMYEDWDMPIFLITDEENITKITEECYHHFNQPANGTKPKQWPLCAAELTSYMIGAGNSDICMRRSNLVMNLSPVRMCDPLSGKNVVATLFPTNKSAEVSNNSVVVIGARIDTFSQFEKVSPGADSSVTGLVTLMAAAKMLADLKSDIISASGGDTPSKNVLFAIFNGEAFDYIGSSRIVYDMEKGSFPLEPNESIDDQPAQLQLHHLSHFLELNQLASHKDDPRVWIHTDPVSLRDQAIKSQVEEIINDMKSMSMPNINVSETKAGMPLPPASFQSFLRSLPSIPGVVLTNHEGEFTNRFYNGMYDTPENVYSQTGRDHLAQRLAEVTSVVVRVVFKLLTNQTLPTTKATPDVSMVSELLDCYLTNGSCLLFGAVMEPHHASLLKPEPFPLYISVAYGHLTNPALAFTSHLLAYFTGTKLQDRVKGNCTSTSSNQIFTYSWMRGEDMITSGICVESTVYLTEAISPAFLMQDWKSTRYSTWTESVWGKTTLRIFLMPSSGQQALTLTIGILILITSFIIVYGINKRASVLFYSRNLVGC